MLICLVGDGKLSKRASLSDFVDVGEGGWFQYFRFFRICSRIFEGAFLDSLAVALKTS